MAEHPSLKSGKLVLIRHADAGNPDTDKWPDDSARPLTKKKGIKKFKKAAAGLGKLVTPERVLTSQFARCLQTASLLEWDANWPAAVAYDVLDDPHTPEEVVADIRALDGWPCTVALVGHGPNLLALLAYLLPESNTTPAFFDKGGAALVAVRPKLKPHGGVMQWYYTNKELKHKR